MSCRLIALLSWYEESPAWLAATVTSLRGCCDHLVALDGAYLLFPEAIRYPRSGREQAEAIVETAYSAGIGVTIHAPSQPWYGNEIEKRTALFRYGLLEAEQGSDWFLCIDADELVTRAPPDLRSRLEGAVEDVAGVRFWQRTVNQPHQPAGAPLANPHPLREGFNGHRVLFRALPDLRVATAHYFYLAGPEDDPRILRGRDDIHELESMLEVTDMEIEHRPHYRQPARARAKERYYAERDRLLVERPVIGSKLARLDGGETLFNPRGERERTRHA